MLSQQLLNIQAKDDKIAAYKVSPNHFRVSLLLYSANHAV
jgi:hypothetical protein